MIHNHGVEEGEGLSCNELRLPDGSLKGKCLMSNEQTITDRAYEFGKKVRAHESAGEYKERDAVQSEWDDIKEGLSFDDRWDAVKEFTNGFYGNEKGH